MGSRVVTSDDLLVAVADSDQDAFAHLYDRMVAPVRTMVRGFIADPVPVDQLVGDVMLETRRTVPAFDRTRSSASRTILSLARRLAAEQTRSRRRSRPRGLGSPWPDVTSEAEQLREVLATLSSAHRHALHLAVHSGVTYHEVAALLDTSPATVLMWMRSGLRQLHAALEAPVGAASAPAFRT